MKNFVAVGSSCRIFATVVCGFSLGLLIAVPATRECAPFIFPMFTTAGVVRLLVQLMQDEERALAIYSWSWTAATLVTFACWVVAQRRLEIVTSLSPYFVVCVCALLALTSAYLRLLIGPFFPRIMNLMIYIVGWGCTWPSISTLTWPVEPLMMCGSIVAGHALSHTTERAQRVAFLRGRGLLETDARGCEAEQHQKPKQKQKLRSSAAGRETTALRAAWMRGKATRTHDTARVLPPSRGSASGPCATQCIAHLHALHYWHRTRSRLLTLHNRSLGPVQAPFERHHVWLHYQRRRSLRQLQRFERSDRREHLGRVHVHRRVVVVVQAEPW